MAADPKQSSDLPKTPPPRPRTLLLIIAGLAVPAVLASSFFAGLGAHLDQTLPPSFRGFYQRPDDYLRELNTYVTTLEGVESVEIESSGVATLDDWAQGDVTVTSDGTVPAEHLLEEVLTWVDDYRPGQKLSIDVIVSGPQSDAEGRWPSADTAFIRSGS